jgi:hypothetical protein
MHDLTAEHEQSVQHLFKNVPVIAALEVAMDIFGNAGDGPMSEAIS